MRLAVIIGRWQPFHNGHLHTIMQSAKNTDHLLILIGSAHQARTFKNPFSAAERQHMIATALREAGVTIPVSFRPIRDHRYDDTAWFTEVSGAVESFVKNANANVEVTLHGVQKDESTWYLESFPQWKNGVTNDLVNVINATDLRAFIYQGTDYWKEFVPRSVLKYVNEWSKSIEGKRVAREYFYCMKYIADHDKNPHPTQINTADAVVFYKGHVLLVVRGAMPGEGLFALPGGHLNPNERFFHCAIREAVEETKFKIRPEWCTGHFLADAPGRSLRGRVISNAFAFKVPDSYSPWLPIVQGGDDAKSAHWRSLSEIRADLEERMFEDHLDIVNQLATTIK
jgi:bifunctional NMN adenylyltransferase/nudix hydrolase